MSDPLDQAMAALAPEGGDRLERAREGVRQVRDLMEERVSLEARLLDVSSRLNRLVHEGLPALLNEVGLDRVGLQAEGNHPAYDATLRPYYKANIGAEWPAQRRAEAFALLDKLGHGDVVKVTITVSFGVGERDAADAVRGWLTQNGLAFDQKLAVPWTTLTALVKEQVENDNGFTEAQLRTLGATVGQIVDVKQRGDEGNGRRHRTKG